MVNADEQIKELRTFGAMSMLDMIEPEILRKQLNDAADTIETLSAKLQAENMERSMACYNSSMIEPCEMLPKVDEKVLVWIEYGTFSGFSIGSIIEDGRCLWDVDCLSGFFDKEVKAWWKLPEYKPQ